VSRVFVSFVHEDKPIAEAIQSLIETELHLEKNVFLSADQSQVLAGHIWLDKIRAALENCEVLILMLSYRSLRRAWVNFEAGAVWLSKRPVIPVCFGHVSKGGLPQPYAGMQAVNIPGDAHYLVKSIHELLQLPGLTPPPPGLKKLAKMLEPTEEKSFLAKLGEAFDPYDAVGFALSQWADEMLPKKSPIA
jgi:hypothetical protein